MNMLTALKEKFVTETYRVIDKGDVRSLRYYGVTTKHIVRSLVAVNITKQVPIEFTEYSTRKVWCCASHTLVYLIAENRFILNGRNLVGRPSSDVLNLLEKIECGKDHSKLLQTVGAEVIRAMERGLL
jgi:hypothetical protein